MAYRSPYEAYPFLADPAASLLCDFELATDEISSLTGKLRAEVKDPALREELAKVCELVYHANPTLRTKYTVTEQEAEWLHSRITAYDAAVDTHGFVLPLGCGAATTAHLLRVKGKSLVRLLYRHMEQGGKAPEPLVDFCNLLSGYFFVLALWLNQQAGEAEIAFVSRNYK